MYDLKCQMLINILKRIPIEEQSQKFTIGRRNNEVIYEVESCDVKAFQEIFRRITGLSLIEYRNKYNKILYPD